MRETMRNLPKQTTQPVREVDAIFETAPEVPHGATVPCVTIEVPLGPLIGGKYASGRCDTDLTHTERITSRRIQDAVEAQGTKCSSPAAVFRYLLAKIAEVKQ